MEIIKKLKENPMNSPLKFMNRLFEARNVAHTEHLKVKGSGAYAAHVALGSFYDSLLDFADGFVESYQGKYGIQDISMKSAMYDNVISYLEDFARYTESSRDIFKDEWLKNQVDEITSLTYTTLYKLKNLK